MKKEKINPIQFIKETWGVSDQDLVEFLRRRVINTQPSPEDSRDHEHYDKEPKATSVNWNPWVGLIENQWDKPRCVAQGIEVMARVRTNRQRNVNYNQGSLMANYDAQGLYERCKQNDGLPDSPGTSPRIGMKMWHHHGLIEQSPDAGTVCRCHEYWRCKNRKQAYNDLLTIGPVAVCVKWYLSFFDSQGVLVPRTKGDQFVGYHQMCLTKRTDDDVRDGIAQGVNSHGWRWGINGHFILPDSQWPNLVVETWAAK